MASSTPNYGRGDGGRSANSTPSGEEMVPTNTSAKAWKENPLRSSICSDEEIASTKTGANVGKENPALDKYLMNEGC